MFMKVLEKESVQLILFTASVRVYFSHLMRLFSVKMVFGNLRSNNDKLVTVKEFK